MPVEIHVFLAACIITVAVEDSSRTTREYVLYFSNPQGVIQSGLYSIHKLAVIAKWGREEHVPQSMTVQLGLLEVSSE